MYYLVSGLNFLLDQRTSQGKTKKGSCLGDVLSKHHHQEDGQRQRYQNPVPHFLVDDQVLHAVVLSYNFLMAPKKGNLSSKARQPCTNLRLEALMRHEVHAKMVSWYATKAQVAGRAGGREPWALREALRSTVRPRYSRAPGTAPTLTKADSNDKVGLRLLRRLYRGSGEFTQMEYG
jgi:hypothetical protein